VSGTQRAAARALVGGGGLITTRGQGHGQSRRRLRLLFASSRSVLRGVCTHAPCLNLCGCLVKWAQAQLAQGQMEELWMGTRSGLEIKLGAMHPTCAAELPNWLLENCGWRPQKRSVLRNAVPATTMQSMCLTQNTNFFFPSQMQRCYYPCSNCK